MLAMLLGSAGCWNLNEGYGEPCETDADCPALLLSCHEVERVDGSLCLTRAPGGAGESCVNELECRPGLRCDLVTATCASGGLGLPECGDGESC